MRWKSKFAKSTPKKLEGKVSKIEKQKFGRKYNLFLDNAFAFSVYEETLIHFNLSQDKVLAVKDTEKILDFDQKTRALNQAYNLLGIRPRSKAEIKERLSQKHDPDVVDEIIEKLEKKKLLSDAEFSRFWATAASRKLKSSRQIRFELYQKKVPEKDINEVLDTISEEQEIAKAQKLVEKVQGRYEKLSEFERKQKLQNLLLRKGYSWDIVKEIIK